MPTSREKAIRLLRGTLLDLTPENVTGLLEQAGLLRADPASEALWSASRSDGSLVIKDERGSNRFYDDTITDGELRHRIASGISAERALAVRQGHDPDRNTVVADGSVHFLG